MRYSIRLTIGALAFAAVGACSRSSEQPALSDDLKQDLARAGGGDVQLAGASNGRVDVVSAAERTNGAVAAPRSPAVTKAPSAVHGSRATARSPRHVTPAAAQPTPRAEQPTPAPTQSPAPPRPSTQREPPGGWKTPGQVIRNAPFPINP